MTATTCRVGFVVAAIAASMLRVSDASACDPAPNYSATLASTDAPECLTGSARGNELGSGLSVKNDCDGDVTVEAGADCPSCGEALVLAPGTEGSIVVETAETSGTRTVLWSTDGASGTFIVDVVWKDNSGACDDFNEENGGGDGDGDSSDDGCSVSTPGGGQGGLVALGAIGIACALRARTRRRA